MKLHHTFKHPVKILAWTVGFLIVLFLAMETWRTSVKPSQENRSITTEQQLDNAADLFHDRQQQLIQQTEELARRLENQLFRDASQQQLYTIINSYSNFWGTTLFEEHEPLIWNKFALALSPDDIQQHSTGNEVSANIKKENNVLYWEFNTDFSVQKDTNEVVSYHLTTLARIEQSIALSIGSNSEFSLADHFFDSSESTISYSFFNALPANTVAYRILSTPDQDSSGVVYARPTDIETTLSTWEDNNWFWRSLFIVLCFVCLSLVFSRWSTFASASSGLLFHLSLIAIGWFVFYLLDIPSRWIPEIISDEASRENLGTYLELSNYIIDGVFLFLIGLALHFKLKEGSFKIEESQFLSALFVGLLTGVGNLSVILAGISSSYNLIAQNTIPLLDLNILPSSLTVLFYLGIGLTFYALGLALVSINRFVLHSGRNFRKVMLAVIALSFLFSLILAQLFVPDAIKLNWASLTAVMCFIFIYGITLYYVHKPETLRGMSVLRATVIICTLIGIAAIPIIYQGYLNRQDTSLQQEAELFAQEEDSQARSLTADILSELHQTLQGITPEDLEERSSFIQANFTNTIQSIVLEEPTIYSLDLQLIEPDGNLVANYSTNLNSPNWVDVYDVRRLSIALELEQISRISIRPIVQRPELRNQDQYETFYRGWIPIFGEGDDAIAWILCSVFKERPNFDKPIRAVMASLNYDTWENSFLLQDYRNNTLYSSSRKGVRGEYPIYNRLRSIEQNALKQDSLFYYTNSHENRNYRHFLWNRGPNQTIKASSIIPDYRNILFSFFRLSFALIFSASFTLAMLHFSKLKQFSFLGNYQKFQNRILDNFILATLLFLILLIVATHFAIKQQNREIVEQELFEKLESLTRTTEAPSLFGQNIQQEPVSELEQWVAPLNVDASYYADRMVAESTTPQIYQQHLIPEALPFSVYSSLYEVQQRNALTNLKLGEQELLIGYRSILNAEGEPQSVVAIPTFAESPKYNQQLLEITSYLIVLYLIVFGLFILGTTFIARQLSKPLNIIQKGLDKISRGNLNTEISVTSDDEIGQLAEAYNTMVQQLKELQKELAVAEREAAWKEMAQQVAHEIKNPLTPMKLNIQHLDRQLKADKIDPEKLKSQVKQITQNLIEQIQSLNNIASDFSRFSKPLDEEFTDVSVNNILESVSNLYNNDNQITLELRLSNDNIIVSGVADELRRVFINLVKNAFEAMPNGGTITLRSYTQNQSVFVEVEDNGVGISEEDKSKIFVPNFSTKSSGTGLGLAITKKVIEAHEGSISFASIENKGTTFIVKLPLKNNA